MKKKDLTELRSKTEADLGKIVVDKKGKLAEISSKTKVGDKKNLKVSKNLRREIAQTLTLIAEKKLILKEGQLKGDKAK